MASESISAITMGLNLARVKALSSVLRKPCKPVGNISGKPASCATLSRLRAGLLAACRASIKNSFSSSSGITLKRRPAWLSNNMARSS